MQTRIRAIVLSVFCPDSFVSINKSLLSFQHKIQNAVLFPVLLPESFTQIMFTSIIPACLFGGRLTALS